MYLIHEYAKLIQNIFWEGPAATFWGRSILYDPTPGYGTQILSEHFEKPFLPLHFSVGASEKNIPTSLILMARIHKGGGVWIINGMSPEIII